MKSARKDSVRSKRKSQGSRRKSSAVELGDLRRLHETTLRVARTRELPAALREILDGALAAVGTSKGLLSLDAAQFGEGKNKARAGIVVAMSAGFTPEFERAVACVPAGRGACGACFQSRERVIVTDVRTDPRCAELREAARLGGFRSCHAVPILKRDGAILGVLTAHFVEHHVPGVREQQLLDLYAQMAADFIERGQVELRLRAHEAQIGLINANVPVILAHMDRESKILFANRAFAERWKADPAELIGRHVRDVLGHEAFALIAPYVRRALAGESVTFELDVPYSDIGRRYVRVSYTPERDAEGRVRGYFSAVTDLTERRRAELALAESEERLRLATRTGKVGLWDWDVPGNRVTWTDSLYEIHGVTRESFDGSVEGFAALVHPEDRDLVRRSIEETLAGSTNYELEFRAIQPSGRIVWLFTNAIVLRESDGRPLRMLGATLDVTERKQSEIALRESEEKFRALARHAPVGIFLTNAQGRCEFVNENWCAMTGLEPSEALGEGWTRALHPHDRERIFAEWRTAVQEHRRFESEYRFLRSDGVVTWVQGSAVAFEDSRGGGMIGTVAEVTQRKAAEFALRESEKRFRTVASRAPVGIFMTNEHGNTVFVNDSWCAISGLSAEQAAGDGWQHAVHPEDRARVAAGWEEAVRRGSSSITEYRFLRADGSIAWVQGNAVQLRDATGRVTGYVGTIADFTARKHVEERLAARESQLRLISTNAPIILAHCSRDGRFLFVNRAYAERFQLEPEAVIGRPIREVIGEEAYAAIEPYVVRVLAGEAVDYETEVPYKTIGPRFMRVSYAPDFDEQGQVRGWLSAISDISGRRQMELTLRENEAALRMAQAQLQAHANELERKVAERTASLREAIAQMEEFSYSVSHDLRSPLRAMNAYAHALVEDYGSQLDETAKNYLTRIQRSSERMEKLTHDLLTYSRIARDEVKLTAIDLEKLLREIIDQYTELQAPAAEMEIRAPLHRVLGHESSLGQCLGNLLTNAAKFVVPGERPKIKIGTTERNGRIRVTIKDEGIGIPPQYQASLFRVFERVPTRAQYSGTGIGLAIVRKAMEKMGGSCGVESDGVHGSTFWIELPPA